jgi:hypothetical protein
MNESKEKQMKKKENTPPDQGANEANKLNQLKRNMKMMADSPDVWNQKIFCIGRNKTGTTSLSAALRGLGITVGNQKIAERLLRDWAKRDFRRLVAYCHTAQAFQDTPFSLPYTFQAMDMNFPGSKFILTVRDNPEQWYRSLLQFHHKLWGEKIHTLEGLKTINYAYPGFAYDARVLVHDCETEDPYDKDVLIAHYNFHNQMVLDYFRSRPQDLLVLNVAEKGAYRKLCAFLGLPSNADEFPWENKT